MTSLNKKNTVVPQTVADCHGLKTTTKNAREMHDTRRRNISGIFIRDMLPQDNGRRKSTCIEDCRPGTRRRWLNALLRMPDGLQSLQNTATYINGTFAEVWGLLMTEEKGDLPCPYIETSSRRTARQLVDDIDTTCQLLHQLTVRMGIYTPGSEADPEYKEE